MDIKKDAENHWKYTEGVIESVPVLDERTVQQWQHWRILVEYIYIQAFIHGYGHGKEDSDS